MSGTCSDWQTMNGIRLSPAGMFFTLPSCFGRQTSNTRGFFHHRLRPKRFDGGVQTLEEDVVAEARVLPVERHLGRMVVVLRQGKVRRRDVRRGVLLLASACHGLCHSPLARQFLVVTSSLVVLCPARVRGAVQTIDAEKVRPHLQHRQNILTIGVQIPSKR